MMFTNELQYSTCKYWHYGALKGGYDYKTTAYDPFKNGVTKRGDTHSDTIHT